MDAQLQQKLKEVKAKIKTNAKDAHFAEALIDELIGLQKQADIEPVELIVPSAEVEHTRQVDDVTTLVRTAKGFLYKHGNLSYVWVPLGSNTLFKTLCELDEILDKAEPTEEEALTVSMINRMLQWHTVAFFDAETLVDSANASVKILNDAIARYENNINPKETEEDIKSNAEFINSAEALDTLIKDTDH